MKVYDAANIRNVALVGHSASGKTQLTSAALFDAGAVNRFGKVDDGTTITDYDDEEIARKHTLSAGLAYAEWNKTKINSSTRRHRELSGGCARGPARCRRRDSRRRRGLRCPGQTEKAWQAADEAGLPRRRGRQSSRSRAREPRAHAKSIHAALSRPSFRFNCRSAKENRFAASSTSSRRKRTFSARWQRQILRLAFRPRWLRRLRPRANRSSRLSLKLTSR